MAERLIYLWRDMGYIEIKINHNIRNIKLFKKIYGIYIKIIHKKV